MEADIENPSQVTRFHVDGVHDTNIVEWSKKRKSRSDQLDLLRPKHKSWVGNPSSEHALIFDQNPVLESMQIHMVEARVGAALHEDSSEHESARDSNSFTHENSKAVMFVSEEGILEADSAKTYLYERTASSSADWDGYDVRDNYCSLDVTTVEKLSSSEEARLVDNEHNPLYHYADLHDLKNLGDHFLGLGSHTDHMYSENAKDSIEESVEKEFEDFLYSKVENPNMYVLSSGRWEVNQEAQSSTRPPTIDQEFEQYFSMLML